MIRGLYSAASALEAASERQEVTAHNLSHASTPGYRARGLAFETFDRALGRAFPPTGEYVGTKLAGVYHDFRTGPVQQTGHPYDLALADPDMFFVVAGPDGSPLYTRSGAFHLNGRGELATHAGYAVQGEAGPVTVPAGAAQVIIAADGTVTADGVPAGRVRLARFANPTGLTSAGPTLYRAGPDAGVQAAEGRVVQGAREGSNVQPADAMVRMIFDARYYEAAQRALRTIGESMQLRTRPEQG